MPPTLSLPHHRPGHHAALPLRAAAPGALGAVVGAIAGLLVGGLIGAIALALAGAVLATAAVRAHRRPLARPRHPAAEPTSTLAVPPPGPNAPPGWYPDPDPDPADGGAGVRRLWDGEAWTEHRWAPRS